jgi:hypothetical protein
MSSALLSDAVPSLMDWKKWAKNKHLFKSEMDESPFVLNSGKEFVCILFMPWDSEYGWI